MDDHYVSTYKQDYTWPQISRARKISPPKSITCVCVRKALEELLQMCGESEDWSTAQSCMERPLDLTKDKPKSKVVNISESCDKNALFSLWKWCDAEWGIIFLKPSIKYPACGKSRDERSALVNANHFKTTYQVDYSDPGNYDMKILGKYNCHTYMH